MELKKIETMCLLCGNQVVGIQHVFFHIYITN